MVDQNLKPNPKFAKLASEEQLQQTVDALNQHNITTYIVDTGSDAKEQLLSIIPEKAEVFTMTSMTLNETGITTEINESGNYQSVRNQLANLDENTPDKQKREMGAAPDWAIGSVQAVSQDGVLLMASNSGSQLPAYAYAAGHVVWVVGVQKIVQTVEEGLERIYEYVFPKEDVRAQEAYGVHSHVSKILIFEREVVPERVHVIFVREELGF